MKELDIASFAESLVSESVNQGKPVQFAAPQAPDAPDISDVRVPGNFADQVLSESFSVKSPPKPVAPQQPTSPKKPINEASLYKQHLLNEYEKKMQDLEELIDIMESMVMVSVGAQTTTGSGMSPTYGGTKERKKKRKSRAPRYTK